MAIITSTTEFGNAYITTATVSGATVSGATVSNGAITSNQRMISDTSAYDCNRDTIYGIPTNAWHKMSSTEQRYFAERWQHDAMRDREHWEYERNAELRRQMGEAPKEAKKLEPAFLTNTKLLLTEN